MLPTSDDDARNQISRSVCGDYISLIIIAQDNLHGQDYVAGN